MLHCGNKGPSRTYAQLHRLLKSSSKVAPSAFPLCMACECIYIYVSELPLCMPMHVYLSTYPLCMPGVCFSAFPLYVCAMRVCNCAFLLCMSTSLCVSDHVFISVYICLCVYVGILAVV